MPSKMTDDARELAGAHVRLAWKYARKTERNFPDLSDEIESAAMMGLCKAAMAFDPGRGGAFSTLAYTCMKSEMLNLFSRLKARSRRAMACFSDISDDDRSPPEPPDHREPSPPDALETKLIVERVRGFIDQLPPRERFVVRRHKLDGLKQEEVAAELAASEGRSRPLTKQRIGSIAAQGISRIAAMERGGPKTAA